MKSIGWLALCCGLICLGACKQVSKPDSARLSPPQMVPVIYGLMMADELGNHLKIRDSSLKMNEFRQEKYSQVFNLNKTDYRDFSESYRYYLGRPGELKLIFDSVEAYSTRARIDVMNPAKKARAKGLEERKEKIESN